MEEGWIFLVNLVEVGTSQRDQEGLVILLCTPWRALEGKVWPEGLCSKEVDTSLDIYVNKDLRNHSNRNLGGIVALMSLFYLLHSWMCVSLLVFLIPCGNHAHLGGGSAAGRLMSALSYGWVERCSDVAGCGTTSFKDKCPCFNLWKLYFLHEIWWTYLMCWIDSAV